MTATSDRDSLTTMKRSITVLSTFALLLSPLALQAEDGATESEFASTTIALGCVVSDIDAAVKFYTEAIGFTEIQGFSVPADFTTEAGLTDHKQLDIRVLVLGDGKTATQLKLMQTTGEHKKSDNTHIDTELGFSYLTIMVNSTDAALARLAKAGVKPIAKGPATLPESLNSAIALTIVRDPDGNLIELVGPKPTGKE